MTVSSPPKVVAYLRDRGAVCYEFPLFFDSSKGGPQRQRPAELLRSGLTWFWTSARTQPASQEWASKGLPSPRSLTRLDETTASNLLNDFDERDVDGYGRHIAMLGLDTGSAGSPSFHPQVRAALTNFANEEAGPIRMLIFQENDGHYNQMFVSREFPPPVRQLLESWGIQPETISRWHRKRYSRLGVLRLENLIDGVAAMASGIPWSQQSPSMK